MKISRLVHALCLMGAVCGLTSGNLRADETPPQIHVPATFDGSFKTIAPDAMTRKHILIVNVNDAIKPDNWPLVVNFAASRIAANVATNSLKIVKHINDPKAVVKVLVRNDPSLPSISVIPGSMSTINLSWLEADKPDAQLLRDRQAKVLLKGIAAACGAGVTTDPKCALYFNSRTLSGLDQTDIAISPAANSTMIEVLQMFAGSDILTTAEQ